MAEHLSDVERATLRLGKTDAMIVRVEEKIASRREAHLPTDAYEHFLENLRTIRSFRQKELDYLSKPAVDYRCYLMIGQSIRGVEVIHCRQDADAILEAAKLLDSKSEFDLIEIWAGARIVGRFPRRPKKPG